MGRELGHDLAGKSVFLMHSLRFVDDRSRVGCDIVSMKWPTNEEERKKYLIDTVLGK